MHSVREGTVLVQFKTHQTQLGFAVLLKYFHYHHQFPKGAEDVLKVVLRYIAQQVNLPAETFQEYSWEGRQ
ncbi:DUF4158 domain-containing protein [Shimazuella alba]|uniref:DUF4158 domain-containing protein n=1 Tax=Shimazuella alba TaxID=2690964 RepID=A0A6I4VLE8_9BACL|nr:DUF4158 domain-containing protein [Shimazuella alba]